MNIQPASAPSAPVILCVHPNRELYGSDRTFIQAVRAFRSRWPDARITILLPGDGPLADMLRKIEPDVRFDDLFVLRRAKLAGTVARLTRLMPRVLQARRNMAANDLTYINTTVVLDYLLASRWGRTARLIHVHELPTGRTRAVFTRILRWSRGRLIFISAAVRDAFPELRGRPAEIVWNGTRDMAAMPPVAHDGPLRLLLIGRFNAWKGQGVLLDALARLSPKERNDVSVRLVGSAYEGQEHFTRDIQATIERHDLSRHVEVVGFDPTPAAHYLWSDVVLVPSTQPEPFGLVAIEAMSACRAVIAADHGGLSEIVVDGETGSCVAPGDPAALADAIRTYRDDRTLASSRGRNGRARFEREFREEAYMTRIADAAAAAMATARATSPSGSAEF